MCTTADWQFWGIGGPGQAFQHGLFCKRRCREGRVRPWQRQESPLWVLCRGVSLWIRQQFSVGAQGPPSCQVIFLETLECCLPFAHTHEFTVGVSRDHVTYGIITQGMEKQTGEYRCHLTEKRLAEIKNTDTLLTRDFCLEYTGNS